MTKDTIGEMKELIRSNQFLTALSKLNSAINGGQTNYALLLLRSHCYKLIGTDESLKLAVEDALNGIKEAPSQACCYYQAGLVYKKVGKFANAERMFQKTFELNQTLESRMKSELLQVRFLGVRKHQLDATGQQQQGGGTAIDFKQLEQAFFAACQSQSIALAIDLAKNGAVKKPNVWDLMDKNLLPRLGDNESQQSDAQTVTTESGIFMTNSDENTLIDEQDENGVDEPDIYFSDEEEEILENGYENSVGELNEIYYSDAEEEEVEFKIKLQ